MSVDKLIGGWYHSYTALHIACVAGHIDVARVLLEHSADVNLRSSGYESTDPKGWSPIATARHYRRTECVALLLHHGADEGPGAMGAPPSLAKGLLPMSGLCHSNSDVLLM